MVDSNYRFVPKLHHAAIARNEISDGAHSVYYHELPGYFAAIGARLAAQGVTAADVVVLATENTVPSALVLLYLLDHGHNFLLVPTALLSADAPWPIAFGRYGLRAGAQDGTLNPAQFLQISSHAAWQDAPWQMDTPKLLMRTSGSTGTPKMAVHTHSHLLGNVRHCAQRFQLTPADRVAIPVPIFHMYGLGAAFLPSVAAGASIDLQKGANLLKFIQREGAFNPNVAFMTPSFCATLLKARKSQRHYRLTVTAGDRCRASLFDAYEAAFGPVVQLYGSTELGAIAAGAPDWPQHIRRRTAGLPMPDVQLQVRATALGEDGALWCKREYGFSGYVDSQGQALAVGADLDAGWFHTKDIARLDVHGCVEIFGRSDHSVNRDGLLVFFAEVEKALEILADLEAVAVVAHGDTERGKKLIALCVPAQGCQPTPETLRAHCFAQLPRRAVPDEVRVVTALPLLPNGKVDRMRLMVTENAMPQPGG